MQQLKGRGDGDGVAVAVTDGGGWVLTVVWASAKFHVQVQQDDRR